MLVATPGRLEDLLERRALSLDHVGVLVLDEADRMLDMGFKPAVDRIVQQLPKKRQTLFFSATLEGAAGKLAGAYTHDPRRHVHAPKRETRAAIEHRFVQVESQGAKLDLLVLELRGDGCDRALVFVRTKRGADRLVKKLRARDVQALAMHGDKSQSQRQKALARFDRGETPVLVATDVAARGIDVPEISHVVQFDAPEDGDTYTHRAGRTGRAGSTGHAVSFVLDDQAHEHARDGQGPRPVGRVRPARGRPPRRLAGRAPRRPRPQPQPRRWRQDPPEGWLRRRLEPQPPQAAPAGEALLAPRVRAPSSVSPAALPGRSRSAPEPG